MTTTYTHILDLVKEAEPPADGILSRTVFQDDRIKAVVLGLAEIELEFRAERQAAGIALAKRKGVYKGRKRGTTKGTPARARELRSRGLTAEEIATALGISPRTVWRYLGTQSRTG